MLSLITYRLVENCFVIKYKALVKNDAFVSTNAVNDGNKEYHYMQPSKWLPPISLDPNLAGQSWFTRIEFTVNGYNLDGPSLGEHEYIFTCLNRTFCKDEVKVWKYGDVQWKPSVTEERECGDKAGGADGGANIPIKQRALMAELDFDAPITSRSRVTRFSFDGHLPLSACSNITAALTGEHVETPFFPPGVSLGFKIFKRDPISALVDRMHPTDVAYYGIGNLTAAREDIKFEFSDIHVVYESKILDKPDLVAKAKKAIYYADVPKLRLRPLPMGRMVTTDKVGIPPGCKYVVLMWMNQNQLYYNAASHKNLNARFSYPPNAKRLRVSIDGHEIPLLYKDGLEDFGTDDACASASCADLYAWMVSKGLYSKKLEKMFPKNKKRSYDQIVPVPLLHLEIKEATEMEVEVTYTGAFSADKQYLCYLTMQQYKYTYHERDEMKSEVVI
jgi:hypothetical protein